MLRAKSGRSSGIETSSIWLVKAEIGASTVERYLSLNNESSELNELVLDAIGFMLFSYHDRRRARIISAEYKGICLH